LQQLCCPSSNPPATHGLESAALPRRPHLRISAKTNMEAKGH
jgi:hypothetical protein